MNFLSDLTEKMNSEIMLYSPIIIGLLKDGNSISIRPTGGSYPVRYVKGKQRNYAFQIMAKHIDGVEAYTMLESIQAYLEGLKTMDGDYNLLKIDATTTVSLQEVNDKNEMIFTALFEATFEE